MKNKLFKCSLSLSANPKQLIKGAFLAVTEVFADFYEKISKFYHIFKWSFWGVNNTTTSKSYLDLSVADSPSIQNQNAISLKQKVFSGCSTNWLSPKVKHDGGVVDALTENSNSVRECDGIFKRRVQEEYTSAKIPSRHQLGEFSLGRYLLPQCALDATGFLSDVYKKGTRAKKFLADDVQGGRSMIEMLGVLAIVGVLSVGGIAGYSKAMRKFKINKMLDDYTMLTTNILEHLDDLKYASNNSSAVGMVDILQSTGAIPKSWQRINNLKIWDTNGNMIALFSRNKEFGFSINIGGYRVDSNGTEVSEGFSQDICLTLFKDLIQPLHSQISKGYTYNTKKYIYYYGDDFCDGKSKKCLSEITLSQMKEACDICNGTTYCDISFMF